MNEDKLYCFHSVIRNEKISDDFVEHQLMDFFYKITIILPVMCTHDEK